MHDDDDDDDDDDDEDFSEAKIEPIQKTTEVEHET